MAESNHTFKKFVQGLASPEEHIYALVDAARNLDLATIPHYLYKIKSEILFDGELGRFAAQVAPHFIPVPRDSEYFDHWDQHLGTCSGILMITKLAPPRKVLAHLRKRYVVKDEADREYLFRYFDPRVLRTFIPTCTQAEAAAFFGPLRMIIVESEEPRQVWICEKSDSGVSIHAAALPPVKKVEFKEPETPSDKDDSSIVRALKKINPWGK